MVAHVKHF